ncbi:hypothetical protein Tco_0715457, partial [Tanacetum coccineum]
PPAAADAVISDPTLEDLTMGIPSAKILAKAEASQKRNASTSGATSSHVAKGTRFPLVTPIRSAAVIPSSGNQGGSSDAPAAEGPGTRDSHGKGIMADDAAAPFVGVSQPRPSSGPVPLFRDIFRDAIHADFFPFSAGPYYATYPEGGVVGNYDRPVPTPREVVRVESLSNDQLTAKMNVLHRMIMSYGGELLAWYRDLLQSHHEYVSSADSRLKGYEERVAGLTGPKHQVSGLKRQISRLNDKLSSYDASFEKSKAKGKDRKKKIKSLTKSLDNLHTEVARLSADLNRATVLEAKKDKEILRLKATPSEFASFFCGPFQDLVQKFLVSNEFSRVQGELLSLAASAGFERGLSMHQTKDEFAAVLKKMAYFVPVILQLDPEKLARPTNVLTSRDARVSPPIAKESTAIPASESLEFPANVVPASSVVALEQNKEWVNAMVDGSDLEMTDGATHAKSEGVFVQGTSYVLDDVAEVTVVGSERVSSGPTDVVVALSVGEKGDGSLLSFAADEEAAANPSGV